MSQVKTSRQIRLRGSLMVAGLFLVLLIWVIRANRSATVEIASKRPVWTAQITGTTGDVAQVWVWTRGATLLTNLSIPAELRLDRRELLLQVRSAGSQLLNLDVAGTEGSTHLQINGGETNSAEFLSCFRYPILPLGGFTTAKLPGRVPLGLEPVYDNPWSTHPSRYEVRTNLPAAL